MCVIHIIYIYYNIIKKEISCEFCPGDQVNSNVHFRLKTAYYSHKLIKVLCADLEGVTLRGRGRLAPLLMEAKDSLPQSLKTTTARLSLH